MKVLLVHNYYKEPGGEDEVFRSEAALLRSYGHEVMEYTDHNNELGSMNKLHLARELIWSHTSAESILKVARQFVPDVVHFHNTFFKISPAAIRACSKAGLPVVQTLHNYRLVCPAATFYRKHSVCERCLGKTFPWPSILYGCWHSSRLQTLPVAIMNMTHTLLHTWSHYVDVTIVLSEFSRSKFVEAGFDKSKIVVKPNFVDDREIALIPSQTQNENRDYAIFLGRLSPEKGVWTLLGAWRYIKHLALRIVGDGRLRPLMEKAVKEQGLHNVEILGYKSRTEALRLLRNAAFLVFPSEWYEACSRTVLESFACGRPVIASNLGTMPEFTKYGSIGLMFKAGDAPDLADKVSWACKNSVEVERMGRNARQEYELKYTPERNYEMLMSIYERAIANHRNMSQTGCG
jgi:glycosyltransferase involved in cell wall biosynthesis